MKIPFEHKSEPLLPWSKFLRRLFLSIGTGVGLILVSLIAGMAGYHYLEGLSWIDAFLNAAMILSGMGPLDRPQTFVGKVFAGTYALYSGFAVLVIAAVAFGPVVHRMLHKLHADERDLDEESELPDDAKSTKVRKGRPKQKD